MTPEGSHIIQKQTIDLVVNGHIDGLELQRQTDELVNKQFMPRFEQLLNKYAPTGLIKIDKLEIEIDNLEWIDFNSQFSQSILNQIEKELSRIIIQQVNQTEETIPGKDFLTSDKGHFIRLFIHTLKYGHLPWWSTVKTMDEWHALLSNFLQTETVLSGKAIADFKLILKYSFSNNRLISWLTVGKYWSFIKLVSNADETTLNNLQGFFQMVDKVYLSTVVAQLFKKILLKAVSAYDDPGTIVTYFAEEFSTELIRLIQRQKVNTITNKKISVTIKLAANQPLQLAWTKIIRASSYKNLDLPSKIEDMQSSEVDVQALPDKELLLSKIASNKNTGTQSEPAELSEEDAIYISNSGLVILAPFLTTFFKKLNLVQDGKLTDFNKAITLLHYLASGSTQFDEFETVLNKILCGIELTEFVEACELTATDKQEADSLLSAVIEHWSALKSTSPDGLRGSFLQREGRLILENKEWKLKVQEQSFDILLSHLPWGISIVKLPWMENILYVNWI